METTKAQQSISDWASVETVARLQRFSALANKSTGSSHPLDRRRWFDFILSAHADTPRLDTDQLKRWLNLFDKQPPVVNQSVAGQYRSDPYTYDLIGRRFFVQLKAKL